MPQLKRNSLRSASVSGRPSAAFRGRTISNEDIDAVAVLVLRRLSRAVPESIMNEMDLQLMELADRVTSRELDSPVRPRRK